MFLSVLFTGKPLTTNVTRERLRLDVRPSVNVQTSALSELFATRITGEGAVASVDAFV